VSTSSVCPFNEEGELAKSYTKNGKPVKEDSNMKFSEM
jgi:hypothetical protein